MVNQEANCEYYVLIRNRFTIKSFVENINNNNNDVLKVNKVNL